ncbi:NEW3 domain-containing protein [Ammoniphilus resinae]|uniref:Membrane protein n=1 Tax=Ammoniphilus resinae TaxID=861532 RepID=A0ABS4GN19_9BACL|nr:NEW3 domain-containing protein [Ammoniphilus resinae]MBP1931682.1 putative membrane protein [Ammoniphilus resinae]
MSIIRSKSIHFLITFLLLGLFIMPTTKAAEGVILFSPYTDISVTPGESIHYSIDVINNSGSVQDLELAVEGLSNQWKHELTAGGWKIQRIAVKPDDSQTVSLDVDVPLEVEKGTYNFHLIAPGKTSLPFTVHITEEGTFKTEFTSEQPNMEGPSTGAFNFETTLRNRTVENQLYSLTADAPKGWDIQFKVDSKRVTSVNVEANSTKDVDVEIVPPENVKAGSYKIPLKAATNSTSAQTELEVVITGTYDLKLSTPSGLLSTDVTAGDERKLQVEVTNTGSANLRDIELKSEAPVNWEVTFEPKKIDAIEAGKSAEVTATIKADQKAIAGDYVVNMTAETAEASSDAGFRVAVKTSLLWGWVGILIILGVIGGMYYLFKKYGRR